jgi:hypothetical protein
MIITALSLSSLNSLVILATDLITVARTSSVSVIYLRFGSLRQTALSRDHYDLGPVPENTLTIPNAPCRARAFLTVGRREAAGERTGRYSQRVRKDVSGTWPLPATRQPQCLTEQGYEFAGIFRVRYAAFNCCSLALRNGAATGQLGRDLPAQFRHRGAGGDNHGFVTLPRNRRA